MGEHSSTLIAEELIGETIMSQVQAFAGKLPSQSLVLDVGCGLRPYEEFFADGSYTGIDVATSGRTEGGKKPDRFFDGVQIPFAGAYFDAIICTEVLEHCVSPEELVKEMYRVLKPGGRILITVPFIWGVHESPFDFRRYSPFGLIKLIEGADFHIDQLGKLTVGIDAIRQIVASEINNFERNVLDTRKGITRMQALRRRIYKRLSAFLWDKVFRFWRKLYQFERIYIDNVVLATRPK